MGKIMNWIKSHLPTQRRLIQLYAALLYNAHIKGFITGTIYTGPLKVLCVPGLNCYSCPGASGACPLGALQNAISASSHRLPAYILGILLLYGLILGRSICGFFCPFGLLQELLHKIPTPKIQKSRLTHALSYLKYVILIVFVIVLPLISIFQGLPLPAFCKYICPAGTSLGALGLLAHPDNADKLSMLGFLFTNKFVILILILVFCIFIFRAFCRFVCPLGAIYGLFAKYAVIGVKVNPKECIDCGKCVRTCPVDISHVSDHECIHCSACIDVCPTNAISFKAGKYTIQSAHSASPGARRIFASNKSRLIAWGIALVLLTCILVWVNTPHKSPDNVDVTELSQNETNSHETTPTVGKDPGMLAPDFSVSCYGGDGYFSLREHREKVIVLNFWATWCAPCIKELPYFHEAQQQYGDSVYVIALHSNLVTADVGEFLSQFDYDIAFALDADNTVIPQFGGSMMLPQTVIINKNGLITYNAVGSLTQEKLNALIEDALH